MFDNDATSVDLWINCCDHYSVNCKVDHFNIQRRILTQRYLVGFWWYFNFKANTNVYYTILLYSFF